MKRLVWIILTIAWISFIFYNSTRIGLDSSAASGSIVGFIQRILQSLNIYINSSTLSIIVRKGAHFFEFFVLAILSYMVIKSFRLGTSKIIYDKISKGSFIIILLFCLLIACTDEFIQYFIPGRASSIIDVLIDFSGSTFAVIFIIILNYKKIKSGLNKL